MERNSMLRFYFQLRDSVASYTGYSRIEIHEIAKCKLFSMLIDDESNFNIEKVSIDDINNKKLSLTMLSDKGLEIFVEGFRVFCMDNFNFYL